jgi:hypothetical protein
MGEQTQADAAAAMQPPRCLPAVAMFYPKFG